MLTEDDVQLHGWYVPPKNGAVVILQHGYKANRSEMLEEASILHRHGYGALITSFRSHDQNPGVRISFGENELRDLTAWHDFLLTRDEVSPDRQRGARRVSGVQSLATRSRDHSGRLSSIVSAFDAA